jgi:hypothetical protein
MNQLVDLKIISAIIAFLTILIAFNQYKINKYKVKYDLYERRFKVFEQSYELLDRIITSRDLDKDNFFSGFVRIKNESQFLFDKKTAQQIEDYFKIGFYYRYYRSQSKDKALKVNELDPDLIRTLKIDANKEYITISNLDSLFHHYCHDQFFNLKSVFIKHLNFKRLF